MRVVFREANEVRNAPPAEGAICLWPAGEEHLGRLELASLVLRVGLEPFRCGSGQPTIIVAPSDPTLDDMLAATIAIARLEQCELPQGMAAFARYAALVREGLHPDKVPFESSPEGIYLAIRRDPAELDLTKPAPAARFLADWSRLEGAILAAASRGLSPSKDDFLSADEEFERERAFLHRDHEVYQLDVSRGEQWDAQIPGGPPDGLALILREPRSILFKRWHRMPPAAGGKRCLLLGVRSGRGRWVFSTDPVFGLSLKPLADRLQELETEADTKQAAADPWFDGARFAHSMIAAPHAGTKLTDDQVLQAVRNWTTSPLPPPAPAPAETPAPKQTIKPTDVDAVVDFHADEFERQWKAGQRPDIAKWVGRAPVEAQPHLLEECLLLDLDYRVRHGETPEFDEYVKKLPQLQAMIRPLRGKWDQAMAELQSGSQTRPMSSVYATPKTAADRKPKKIRRYVVIEKLPKSGQAELYRAVDPELRREVLIKWYFATPGTDAGAKAFQNEASVLAQLSHPNLARIFGLDRYKARPFLVMEYINGMNLRQYAAVRPLPPKRAARLVAQVARAVAFAHSRSVFHYDIKPENILVDRTGRAKLIDFGLARIRSAWDEHRGTEGEIFGTPGYMPPEQANANADRLGPASDTFALGGVLYFLLTGKDPLAAPTIMARLELARKCQWDRDLLASADAPEPYKQICTKALSAAPAERYTASVLAAELGKLARDTAEA